MNNFISKIDSGIWKLYKDNGDGTGMFHVSDSFEYVHMVKPEYRLFKFPWCYMMKI
jgi:hypothetical protein